MILALLSCFSTPTPEVEIDAKGIVIRGESMLFPDIQPSATRLIYPPDFRPLELPTAQFADEYIGNGQPDYWLKIHPDTHIGWLYRFAKILRGPHRDSPEGPPIMTTDPFGEFPSDQRDCWLVVLDMERGIPQITPATTPGILDRSTRPRRLGADGQCVRLTPAELPGFLERVPERCDAVVLEADHLTWRDAEPWFDVAPPNVDLMYPKMLTIWRSREEQHKARDPDYKIAEINDWKCDGRLDLEQLKNPGFSNKNSKVTPNWARVWHGEPADDG